MSTKYVTKIKPQYVADAVAAAAITFDVSEMVYQADTFEILIGDGNTAGGQKAKVHRTNVIDIDSLQLPASQINITPDITAFGTTKTAHQAFTTLASNLSVSNTLVRINDAGTTATDLWSASKIQTSLDAISSEISSTIHEPVQDITSLRAIDTTNLGDKVLILVEDSGQFRFDLQSTATDDGTNIIQPTTGSGRWIKLLNLTGYATESWVTAQGFKTSVNLGYSRTSTAYKLTNDAGDDVYIYSASTSYAGAMTATHVSNLTTAYNHTGASDNPHNVTAAQVGALSSVPTATSGTIGGFKLIWNIAGYTLDNSQLQVNLSKFYDGTPATSDTLAFYDTSLGAMRKTTISSILALGGSEMTYPGAGIAVSTGSAWGTSITNNSSNWNTAYSWGNHADQNYLTTIPTASTTVTGGFKTINNIGGYYLSSGVLRVDSSKYNTGTPTTSSVIAFHNGSTMYKASISEILALSASNQWSTDTEGIYTNSNVGIGGNSIAGYRLKIYGSITTTDSITVSENITVVKKVSAAGYTCSQYYSTSSAPNSTLFAVGSNLYYKDASGTVHTIV